MTTYFDVDLTVASDGSLTWTHGGTVLSRNDELDLGFIEGMYQGSGPYNEVRISFAPPTQWKDCQAGATPSTAPLTHAVPQAGESEGFAFCINSTQRSAGGWTDPKIKLKNQSTNHPPPPDPEVGHCENCRT